MSEPYIGTITYFAGNFAIRGYALCQGQIMSIQQYTALFSILGTTYGGNGQTTFALPDLRGRAPLGQGQGPGLEFISLGEVSGTPSVTLTALQLPAHTHTATFASTATLTAATAKATLQLPDEGSVLARAADGATPPISAPRIYGPASTPTVNLGGLNVAGTVTVGVAGGSQPVGIRNPYLGLNALIALEGIFPSRN